MVEKGTLRGNGIGVGRVQILPTQRLGCTLLGLEGGREGGREKGREGEREGGGER